MAYSNQMTGFTKLFTGIVFSTVWQEPLHTRVVWVTMLALADRMGRVLVSQPGLAKASGVTMEQCTEALDCFLAPDPWSRTKAHDGRRIEEIDGGWLLLNYIAYRELRDSDERRIANREHVREHRARKRKKPHVSDVSDVSNVRASKPHVSDVSNIRVSKPNADAEAEADAEAVTALSHARAREREETEPPPELTDPLHRSAWTGLCRASPNPSAWVASVRAVTDGLHPPVYPWPVVGQALADIAGNGQGPNVALLRACCRRLVEPQRPTAAQSLTPKQQLEQLRQDIAAEKAAGARHA